MRPILTFAALAAFLLPVLPAAAQQTTTLNVITAGSQNMVDYVKDYLGPKFEKAHPGVKVVSVGTGEGDAGSQKIYEKLKAQENNATWDVDVAVIHQKIGGVMAREGMLQAYRDQISTSKLVTRDTASNALGNDVGGYVMPMFHSQTAIAYNPALVPNPPKSYEELDAWARKNPKAFGYNGIKGGMSGVSFVVGWVYAFAPGANQLMTGPFDAKVETTWDPAFAKLKDFNKYVTFTPGNAGTLDLLSRGEIAMGPVWVDMFYSWMAEGKLPPNLGIILPAPGMPGQPMYYVVPKKAAHEKLARDFIELATSPEVQAQGIVERFNWYPGIDAGNVQNQLPPATWNKLFKEVSPADLADRGKPFPVEAYFNGILKGYETKVIN